MKIRICVLLLIVLSSQLAISAQNGFDQYGYNYKARIFVGIADGINKVFGDNDQGIWGNDRLVMKWSKAWDNAKYNGGAWTCDAWIDNEWNGMVPNGSGESWHYKIVWVGPAGENSPCWKEGGYSVWGEFEVIFSHGTDPDGHIWDAHAKPSGYGGN